jgi:integrase
LVHIPGTKKRVSKVAKSENFNEALAEMITFKEELRKQGFHKVEIKVKTLDTTVAGLMKEYLNYISGNGTHAHLNKKLSDDHIQYYKKIFLRFCEAIKKAEYNPELLDVKDINDDVVEIFHFHIESFGLNKTTYTKHFVLMKAFINWVIEKKDYKIHNAFSHVSLQIAKRPKNPIAKAEFEKLIEVTTPENGISIDEKTGKKRNRYKTWLTTAFKIGLETGLRREEIVSLQWNNIRELNYQGNSCIILDVHNLKNNRRKFGEDKGEYVKPIPVTKGLYILLMSLGYKEKKGTEGFIIEREGKVDIKYLLDEISRGFAHFIKLVTTRKIEFKDLRKTYITQLSMRLGKNTKLFTGHSDDQVLRDSYIAEEFISANLSDFSVFSNESLLKAS